VKAEVIAESVVISCSRDEVSTLLNCMNEALEAIQDWEFQTRLGVGRGDVRLMMGILDDALGADG
jgi:hypothetical protein